MQLSAAQVRDRGIRVAECLRHSCGLESTDAVGICSENRLEFTSVMLGTTMLGACLAPMNPAYTERELEHALTVTRPKIIFVSPATAAACAAVAKRLPFVERLIVFDEAAAEKSTKTTGDGGAEQCDYYSEFVNNPAVPAVRNGGAYICRAQNIAETVNVVLFSSGTTGLPKGVQLTQWNDIMGTGRFK